MTFLSQINHAKVHNNSAISLVRIYSRRRPRNTTTIPRSEGDHNVQFYVLYSVLTHVPFLSLFVYPFWSKFLLGGLLKVVSCVP